MFVFLTDDRIIYSGLQLALFVGAISLAWQISPAQSGFCLAQWEVTGMQINQEGGETEIAKLWWRGEDESICQLLFRRRWKIKSVCFLEIRHKNRRTKGQDWANLGLVLAGVTGCGVFLASVSCLHLRGKTFKGNAFHCTLWLLQSEEIDCKL